MPAWYPIRRSIKNLDNSMGKTGDFGGVSILFPVVLSRKRMIFVDIGDLDGWITKNKTVVL
jgi:hypothetical protein